MKDLEIKDVEPMALLMQLAKRALPDATTINIVHEVSRSYSFMRLPSGREDESHSAGTEETWSIEAVEGSSLNPVMDARRGSAIELASAIQMAAPGVIVT